MSLPDRQSVTRRGFLATMAAVSAAVGAFSLSAREASAAPGPGAALGEPLGSAAHAASQRAGVSLHTHHTSDKNAAPSQMTAASAQGSAIRPFVVNVPEADLDDLRRRIVATRWSDRETVADASQGAQLEKLQALVRFWGTEYDWR